MQGLSKLFQKLGPECLKDRAKVLNEDGSQRSALQVKATCHGQGAEEGDPAPLQGRKCIATHSRACSMGRADFFDLVFTNNNDTKANQTQGNKQNL